jgi:hypothetical protein
LVKGVSSISLPNRVQTTYCSCQIGPGISYSFPCHPASQRAHSRAGGAPSQLAPKGCKDALLLAVVGALPSSPQQDPINGCQIGTKCPILQAKQDQVYHIGSSDGRRSKRPYLQQGRCGDQPLRLLLLLLLHVLPLIAAQRLLMLLPPRCTHTTNSFSVSGTAGGRSFQIPQPPTSPCIPTQKASKPRSDQWLSPKPPRQTDSMRQASHYHR